MIAVAMSNTDKTVIACVAIPFVAWIIVTFIKGE